MTFAGMDDLGFALAVVCAVVYLYAAARLYACCRDRWRRRKALPLCAVLLTDADAGGDSPTQVP